MHPRQPEPLPDDAPTLPPGLSPDAPTLPPGLSPDAATLPPGLSPDAPTLVPAPGPGVGPGQGLGRAFGPGSQVGELRLLERLGEGGMGAVYLAEHVGTGARYALKALSGLSDPELVERFRREGLAQAAVDDHPHVIRVHSAGVHDGRHYLVMDLATGGDLGERLARGPLPLAEAARLVADLAGGLAHLHGRGILHRDLKPANVLFDDEGRARLTDFGLARVAGMTTLTRTGDVMGTPSYMAPEQAGGPRTELGPWTDTYGLGAILYHVLTGRAPFTGASLINILRCVLEDAPEPPSALRPELPAEADRVCLKALAKDPRARYPTATALAEDLLRLVPGETGEAEEAPPRRGMGRALVGLAFGLLGVVLIAALYAWATAPLPVEWLEPSAARVRGPELRVVVRVPGASRVEVEGAEAAALPGGRFARTLQLASGRHELRVEAFRGDSSRGLLQHPVVVDAEGPRIVLDVAPVVSAARVELRGTVEDAGSWVELRLNGGPPQRVVPGEPFALEVALIVGDNPLRLESVDDLGTPGPPWEQGVLRRRSVDAAEFLRGFDIHGVHVQVDRDLEITRGERVELGEVFLNFAHGVRMVCHGELSCDRTHFAGSSWGGLTLEGPDARARLLNVSIAGAEGPPQHGGAISVLGGADLEMLGGRVRDSRASEAGGGLLVVGAGSAPSRAYCKGTVFRANKARDGGGIALAGHAVVTLEGCSLEDNDALLRGGGVRVQGAAARSSRLRMRGGWVRKSEAGQGGGGFDLGAGADVELVDVSVRHNRARREHGGGLALRGHCTLTMRGGELADNRAKSWGGGVFLGGGAEAALAGFKAVENRAHWGGAIGLELAAEDPGEVSLRCTKLDLSYNHAERAGGAAAIHRLGQAWFRDCEFRSNHAGTRGAGLDVAGPAGEGAQVELAECRFAENQTQAHHRGRAVWVSRNAECLPKPLDEENTIDLGRVFREPPRER